MRLFGSSWVLVAVSCLALACAALLLQRPPPRTPGTQGLDGIVSPGARLEKVVGGFGFAESPLWRPDGSVLVSDIVGNTIWKVDPRAGLATPYRSPSFWANGQTEYVDGTVLTAEHAGTISKSEIDGTRVELLASFEGKRLNSPDDLAVAPNGTVCFTDPPFGFRTGFGPAGRTPELGFSGVYL
jgi:gluconolactonase